MPIFQVLQLGLRTGRVTLLDDDNGIRYAQSITAATEEKPTPHLYTVDDLTGQVFELNYAESTHPYDNKTVQATMEAKEYAVSSTEIRSLIGAIFATAMVGDTIRFRSSKTAVHDQARVILTATELVITFAAVLGLGIADTFLIAPVRFRVRWAPMIGSTRTTVKTVKGLQVRARPGERTAAKELTVRLFQNYAIQPVSEVKAPVFVGDESGRTTDDRILLLEAQGGAVELELESLETGNDFELELIEAEVHEEADQRLDQKA